MIYEQIIFLGEMNIFEWILKSIWGAHLMQSISTTCSVSKRGKKVWHLPKMLQLALQESTLTFQLYYWILLGVNFNIHVVLCSKKGGLLIVRFLQNGELLTWNSDAQYVGSRLYKFVNITTSKCNSEYPEREFILCYVSWTLGFCMLQSVM